MKVSWKEIILRVKEITANRWVRMCFWAVLYILWVIWLGNYWWLLGLGVIFDIFITKKVKWAFWKKTYKEGEKHRVWNDWLDAIIFAVIVVTFINIFFFQAFVIPSPSMEGTLKPGDHVFVSKLAYGPRIPMTPLTIPFTHNTIFGGESYSTLIQNKYRRMAGFGDVKRGDIVVFNFPNGDTVMRKDPAADYHQAVRDMGSREAVERLYGPLIVRPVDKTDHYVKRCVALPGDSLEVRDGLVWINGTKQEVYDGVQIIGEMHTAEHPGVRCLQGSYTYEAMRGNARLGMDQGNHSGDFVSDATALFPYYSADCSWTRDFYGPVWIPKKGTSVVLTAENLPLYKRLIEVYEGGKATPGTTYTFQQDYYFMMGDNRHNSLDSRYWGFVPEDHIVGKPFMIWLSTDPEKGSFPFNIRWNRFFKFL